MFWKSPHLSKVYEAIGALADSRLELLSECSARCYSSSMGKYYEVEYDSQSNAIMSNDNSAYFTGKVSYPMIAFLMLTGKIWYDKEIVPLLKGFHWKAINLKYKNDYDKTIEHVLLELKNKGIDVGNLKTEIEAIYQQVCDLKLQQLGKRQRPPVGY